MIVIVPLRLWRNDDNRGEVTMRVTTTVGVSRRWSCFPRHQSTSVAAKRQSGPARDGVALAAQVFSQILFHLDGGLVGHGIQVRVEFRQEPDPIFVDGPGGFVAVLVILKAMLHRETRHADIDARLGGIAFWIQPQDGRVPGHRVIEEDDVDIVMEVGVGHLGSGRGMPGSRRPVCPEKV